MIEQVKAIMDEQTKLSLDRLKAEFEGILEPLKKLENISDLSEANEQNISEIRQSFRRLNAKIDQCKGEILDRQESLERNVSEAMKNLSDVRLAIEQVNFEEN